MSSLLLPAPSAPAATAFNRVLTARFFLCKIFFDFFLWLLGLGYPWEISTIFFVCLFQSMSIIILRYLRYLLSNYGLSPIGCRSDPPYPPEQYFQKNKIKIIAQKNFYIIFFLSKKDQKLDFGFLLFALGALKKTIYLLYFD